MTKIIETEKGYCNWDLDSDMFLDDEGYEVDGKTYVHIHNLFVRPEFRGKGVARELLTSAIATIKSECPGMEIKIVPAPKEKSVDFFRLAAFYESFSLTVVV